VITEGYKREAKPKIEVVRAARHTDVVLKSDSHLVAVVSDINLNLNVPVFDLEDVERLADFIEETYLYER
jgi:molybdopterin-guanine dinucleotide biosynthesis protein B